MQRDGPAALAVRDLDPQPEQVAELALERGEIGIDRARARRSLSSPTLAGLVRRAPAARPGAPTARR